MGFLRIVVVLFLVVCHCGSASFAQISSFPFVERFDSVSAPSLPPAWSTSSNRLTAGDFFSTSTSPHSPPYAVQSTNSTIPQHVLSPFFDFSDRIPDKLTFWIARSGTHTSPLVVEASVDSGLSFPFMLGDTLRNPGTTGYIQTVLSLPESLLHHTVRFRWRLLGGAGGTAGTFRMDDIEISVLTSYDLAIGNGNVAPAFPTTSDPLSVTFTVRNDGALPSPRPEVQFFFDHNRNGEADLDEQFLLVPLPPLLPADSTMATTVHPPLRQGNHRFMSVVKLPGDENSMNDTSEVDVVVGVAPGTIVVNEIMYAPTGDEPEWIELFNASDDSVNLKNWRISDNNIFSKTIVSRADVTIPPHSYAIIAKDSTIFTVHANIMVPVALAGFPALNNTSDDAVVISDDRLLTMDSIRYFPFWGGQGGTSLERADAFALSNDPANWSTSLDSAGSTPGTANSTIRSAFDLALGEIRVSENLLSIVVTNVGRETAISYNLLVFADRNHDGDPRETELVESIPSSGPLPPRGSVFLSYDWSQLPPGETTAILLVDFPSDQRLSNNLKTITLEHHFFRNALVINEIMFEPLSGKSEWFELFNPGNDPVDLHQWTFSGSPSPTGSGSTVTIVDVSTLVSPAGFAVVSSDSTILDFSPFPQDIPVLILNKSGGFSFGNEGDDLIIKDGTGLTIDSVRYSPAWHQPALSVTRGRSLERINPEFGANDPHNWSTSASRSGGSPGMRNTIFTSRTPVTGSLSFSPNPFSPDGDGFEDFCLISYRLPRTTALIRVTIFDLRGRVIRTLANTDLSGNHGEIVWDGTDDQERRVRIGPHIVLLEAVDGQGGSVATLKGVIVVAAKL